MFQWGKIESVVLVGQKSVICYIQMVVVALLSVYLVESVDLVSVDLVVNCICESLKRELQEEMTCGNTPYLWWRSRI